jgi:hypothetical protein
MANALGLECFAIRRQARVCERQRDAQYLGADLSSRSANACGAGYLIGASQSLVIGVGSDQASPTS